MPKQLDMAASKQQIAISGYGEVLTGVTELLEMARRTAARATNAVMLKKGAIPKPDDAVTPEEEIKDPFVLEFLGLKDEYSEKDLEEALTTGTN